MADVKAISSLDGRRVEALVRAHQGSVRGFLVFLGCPGDLLDDLVQDVFLAVLASPFDERSREETAGYLRKVAHHLLIKTLARERRRRPSLPLAQAEEAWIEFDRDDGGSGYVAALRACLRRLKGRAREVLRMRYELTVPRAEIAERLELSEAGVKSILVRARRKLRGCIETQLEV